jgi:NADPH:quinone reductase-like Zn-dependent oxidoreductase
MNRPAFRYARTLRKHGRYVSVGGAINRILSALVLAPIIALFSGKYIKMLALKPNKNLAYINDLYLQKLLKPVIDGPYTIDELPRLMKYFAEGKHKGKIVIVF